MFLAAPDVAEVDLFVDVPPLLTIYIVISFQTVQDEFPAFVMES